MIARPGLCMNVHEFVLHVDICKVYCGSHFAKQQHDRLIYVQLSHSIWPPMTPLRQYAPKVCKDVITNFIASIAGTSWSCCCCIKAAPLALSMSVSDRLSPLM